MGQVESKVAIITGGASGLGAACAMTLAREGDKVVVTALDDAGGQAVVDSISSAGGVAVFLLGRCGAPGGPRCKPSYEID